MKKKLSKYPKGGKKTKFQPSFNIDNNSASSTSVARPVIDPILEQYIAAKTPQEKKAAEKKWVERRIKENPESWSIEDTKKYGVAEPGIEDASLEATDAVLLTHGLGSLGKAGIKLSDKYFTKVGRDLAKIKKQGLKEGLSEYEIAKRQLEQVGITSNQRQAYVPGVSDFLENYVLPYGYDGKIKQTLKNVFGRDKSLSKYTSEGLLAETRNPAREDAWSLYLGKPQQNNTFRIAETSPVNHPAYPQGSLKNMDIYSVNYEDELIPRLSSTNPHIIEQRIEPLFKKITYDREGNVMGGYNRRLSGSGLQYNDIWDLEPAITIPVVNKRFKIPVDKFIGKPFMSHGTVPYTWAEHQGKVANFLESKIADRLAVQNELGVNLNPTITKYLDQLDRVKKATPIKKYGGYIEYPNGGTFLTAGNEYHRIYKNADGDIMVNHPKEDKGKWDTINLTDKANAKTVADGVAATKKWHRENPYGYGGSIFNYPDGGKVNTLEGDLISKVIMNRNRNKDFVQRAYALGQNPGMFTLQDPENFGNTMSHKMAWGEDETGQAYMYPTIMNPGNEAIKVPNQYADYISSEGYKKATGIEYAYGGLINNTMKKRTLSKTVYKYGGKLPQHGTGATVGSLVGAGIGALLAPATGGTSLLLGASLGSSLGSSAGSLAEGFFGSSDSGPDEKEMQRKQNIYNEIKYGPKQENPYVDVTQKNFNFPYGGVIDQHMANPNAELELEETFQTPDGTVGRVDGPSHDNGGIEVNLPEGTKIFSDRLKYKNGRTYAQITKPITTKIAKLEKKLQDNPQDVASANTVYLLNQQLDHYFDDQETNKSMKEIKRTLKMANGGMIKRADGSYSRRGLWDNIRANKGSGKKPTKEMLEQERKIKAQEKAMGGYMYAEGGINNPGFRALPEYVQEKIIANMEMGGYMYPIGGKLMNDPMFAEGGKLPKEVLMPRLQAHMSPAEVEEYLDEYGSGGYTVRKTNERKGKTHVVIGPDGTKKYFGDPKMGEKGKSKYGKEAFYARHKKNLDKNPYFRAYARATWQEGGTIGEEGMNQEPLFEYKDGGIYIKPENRGKFTAYAKAHGKGVQEMASHIMANKEDYSPTLVKRANFARNAAKWKHEHGGYLPMYVDGDTVKKWEDFGSEEVLNTETPVSVNYSGTPLLPAKPYISTKLDKELQQAEKQNNVKNIEPVKKAMIKNSAKTQSFKPIANDALQVLEEKKKDPNWKNFKGNYSIYSKENSTFYLFDNNHNLIGQTRAGRGMGKGDMPNLANPNDWYDSSKSKKGQEKQIAAATTPAGSYALTERPMDDDYGTKVYGFGQPNQYNAQTSIHGVYKGDYYNRTRIINDPNIKQAFVSNGCLNIPAKFLNQYDNQINTGDSLFITKEPKFEKGGLVKYPEGNELPYSKKRQYMLDYLSGKYNIKDPNGTDAIMSEDANIVNSPEIITPRFPQRAQPNTFVNFNPVNAQLSYPDAPPVPAPLSAPNMNRPQTQDFQNWLDANKPGWVKGRSLNKGKGYGNFGPSTTEAWNKYGSDYMVSKAVDQSKLNQLPGEVNMDELDLSGLGETTTPATRDFSNVDDTTLFGSPTFKPTPNLSGINVKDNPPGGPTTKPESWASKNMGTIGQVGAGLAGAALRAYNLSKVKAPEKLSNLDFSSSMYNPNLVDYSANINAANRSAISAMDEAQRGFGSSAAAQAFKNKARLNQLETTGKIYQGQENVNKQLLNEARQRNQQVRMQEQAANQEIARQNMENAYNYNVWKQQQKNQIIQDLIGTTGNVFGGMQKFRNDTEMANILAKSRANEVNIDALPEELQLSYFRSLSPGQQAIFNERRTRLGRTTFEFGGMIREFKDGGIHIKPENRGKFTATKKRTGKSTEELTHSKNPLTRKRAIFAQNAKKWAKK